MAKPATVATRSASQQVLNVLGAAIPELLGGSADLTGSNNTNHKASITVSAATPAATTSTTACASSAWPRS